MSARGVNSGRRLGSDAGATAGEPVSRGPIQLFESPFSSVVSAHSEATVVAPFSAAFKEEPAGGHPKSRQTRRACCPSFPDFD
jgi:hypothetical protein